MGDGVLFFFPPMRARRCRVAVEAEWWSEGGEAALKEVPAVFHSQGLLRRPLPPSRPTLPKTDVRAADPPSLPPLG